METQAGFLISQIKQIGGRVFEKILAQEQIDEFNGAQGHDVRMNLSSACTLYEFSF